MLDLKCILGYNPNLKWRASSAVCLSCEVVHLSPTFGIDGPVKFGIVGPLKKPGIVGPPITSRPLLSIKYINTDETFILNIKMHLDK